MNQTPALPLAPLTSFFPVCMVSGSCVELFSPFCLFTLLTQSMAPPNSVPQGGGVTVPFPPAMPTFICVPT